METVGNTYTQSFGKTFLWIQFVGCSALLCSHEDVKSGNSLVCIVKYRKILIGAWWEVKEMALVNGYPRYRLFLITPSSQRLVYSKFKRSYTSLYTTLHPLRSFTLVCWLFFLHFPSFSLPPRRRWRRYDQFDPIHHVICLLEIIM